MENNTFDCPYSDYYSRDYIKIELTEEQIREQIKLVKEYELKNTPKLYADYCNNENAESITDYQRNFLITLSELRKLNRIK